MSTQRFAATALLLVLAAATLASSAVVNSTNNSKSHHLIIGSRVWGDRLLQRVHVQKDYSWFRVVKETRTFPGDGISKITEIQALDQTSDGSGAHVALINGGPDQTFVTLQFKSQRSQSIDFVVEIYGKR
ncbi:hypothetical protein TSAR_003868 [Trichomalopsis sarcophagae]|uniref:Salivary secreted peptide n=1 Tax=Trichomalopsis sarcophagae TaxID=543379 RepID=A0A232FAK7_9HYME|nr:hypothetical protein TSAR_003868 [Trichomalopsis sarcophagae]